MGPHSGYSKLWKWNKVCITKNGQKSNVRSLKYSINIFSRMVVCAGGNSATRDLELYSFELNTWTVIPNAQAGLPSSRLMSQISIDDTLYFIGRFDFASGSASNEIYIFHPENVTVEQVGVLNQPMDNVALILFNT